MNTIIQIWNLFFNYVFSDNGFLVAFGFAALGVFCKHFFLKNAD